MIEGIPIDIGQVSGWGVVGILVVMLLTGRGLATRREVDAAERRADTWQDAWKTAMAASEEKDAQNVELLENSRTAVRILQALPEPADRSAAPSGSEDSS